MFAGVVTTPLSIDQKNIADLLIFRFLRFCKTKKAIPEVYLEPFLAKIDNDFETFIIFVQRSFIDVWLGLKYPSEFHETLFLLSIHTKYLLPAF